MRVAVVAAHPDDEVLGIGGTLARHVVDGDDVTAIIVSEGASARYASGAERTLAAAAARASQVLGLGPVRCLGLPDQRLDTLGLLDVVRAVEAALRELRPDVVYTHHWGDLNRDHRIVSEAVQVACRPMVAGAPRRLYAFETPSSSEWGVPDASSRFTPGRFVDVTSTLERKLEAIRCYDTELRPAPHPRSLQALRDRAAYWGQHCGVASAEPLVVLREVV